MISSAGSCGYGVCACGVCDDRYEDDVQECRGDTAFQDGLPDADSGYARTDVRRSHEVYDSLVRATQWNESIDKYRETGEASLKCKLPAFIFQATFDETESKKGKMGAWRKQSATRLTGLVVMDVDHVESEALKVKSEEFAAADFPQKAKELGILLIYITPSGHGLKIVFKARVEWGNLIDNQHAMAKVLGVEVDESCKDASRMSFICKESDILYIDKELFTYENKEFAEKFDAEYRAGHSRESLTTSPSPKGEGSGHLQAQNTADSYQTQDCILPSPVGEGSGVRLFKGRPYSDIIDEWWKRNGGVPQEGERNVKLYQLAVSLRAICDNNKQLLMRVMPRLGLDEQELTRIVDLACKEQPKGISKMLASILSEKGIVNSEEFAAAKDNSVNQRLWEWGAEIEALSEEFPLLKDICKGLKRNQYPAAMFVGGGLLMTLMTRCTYRFYHRPEELRRLNNSTLIIGDPASGKSFATRLFKLLAAPIVAADKVGKDAINAYRELMKTKGATKEKPKKPKVVVRVHLARTSNAQFTDEMLLKRCAYHGLNFSAPFIVMRHWDKMKQDGDYWCGEFETDEVDWRLAELITNIQFACQRHYFGTMAENYFDNKLKDASVNVQRKQKTYECFARLPEEFTNEDVMRCFNLSSEGSARSKTSRLQRDHLIEKVREERGTEKALFRKTGTILL